MGNEDMHIGHVSNVQPQRHNAKYDSEPHKRFATVSKSVFSEDASDGSLSSSALSVHRPRVSVATLYRRYTMRGATSLIVMLPVELGAEPEVAESSSEVSSVHYISP